MAERFGVTRASIQNWERGAWQPAIQVLPKIIAFLGHDPEPEPTRLPARIAYARRRLGLTQDALATALGVDSVTVYRWEHGLVEPATEKLGFLQRLLGDKLILR